MNELTENEDWIVTETERGYNTYPISIEESKKPLLSLHTCEVLLRRYGGKPTPDIPLFKQEKTAQFDRYDEESWLAFLKR